MHVSMLLFYAGEIVGTVVGGLVIVAVIAAFFVVFYYARVHRDALRSRGRFN